MSDWIIFICTWLFNGIIIQR